MTDRVCLKPEYLQVVKALLSTHVPHNAVWAFGSRVGGQPKPHSDLDLVIIDPPEVSDSERAKLRLDFEESDLPMRVDVLLWSELDDNFRKIILRNYVAL